MNVLTGLSPEQEELIRRSSAVRYLGPGDQIFFEGDPAEGLFIILLGEVEIYRTDAAGKEHRLNLLSAGDIFGEMGLLTDIERRTASARAAGPCELLYLDGNPIKALKRVGSPEASLQLFKNLVSVLGDRLAQKDKSGQPPILNPVTNYTGRKSSTSGALRVIADAMPGGPLRRMLTQRVLEPGEFLFHYYDEVDGFYLLLSGEMEAVFERGQEVRSLGLIKAPALLGEVAYFTYRSRSAGLRATQESRVDHFSAKSFEKLQQKDPERAVNVLFAIVELIVARIVERENA
jgi:CRP-like cAMP-binding protein